MSDGGCFWTRVITTSEEDHITAYTEDQIIAHNMAWDRFCGSIRP